VFLAAFSLFVKPAWNSGSFQQKADSAGCVGGGESSLDFLVETDDYVATEIH